MKRDDAPSVALLVDTATGWGQRLISGVAYHAKQRRVAWDLWVDPHNRHDFIGLPKGWHGDGIIARVATPRLARHLAELEVPVVNVSNIRLQNTPYPRVTADLSCVVRLVTQYFFDRGFRNFAFFSELHASYVAEYRQAYVQAIARAGYHCDVYRRPAGPKREKQVQEHLASWLIALPKPAALLCWSLEGITVLHACRSVGLKVPEEVAVLSGDEDDLLCDLTYPPLSAVETPSEMIGRQAAKVLETLMAGRKPAQSTVLVPPTRVVTRQSTDTLAIEDSDVAAALQFIRQRAREGIDVADVLNAVPISRRSLERRFLKLLGRTPADEIRRVRLDRAQQLLIQTDMSIPQVAAASGFGSPEYMSYVFKTFLKLSPRRFRQKQLSV